MREQENKTEFREGEIVDKCDPRMEFRGQLDSLSAWAILTCAYAEHFGYTNIVLGSQDVVRVLKDLTHAEALGKAPETKTILGMSLDELREVSHNPRTELGLDPYTPDEHTDLMTAHLNCLRTRARDCERAFSCLGDNSKEGQKMQTVLNRLSSAAYILMLECRSERA